MEQLEKILALIDSSHEGESLGALRMAQKVLARNGLRFRDLARGVDRPFFRTSFFSGSQAQLEARIEQLQDDLAANVEQNESLSLQIEFWRSRAAELEQSLALSRAEGARWKATARETAERLWDIGQLAHIEASLSAIVDENEEEEIAPEKAKKAG